MGADQRQVGGATQPLRPYLTLVLLMPLLASTLGIDGGAVFQIVAVEELGLSARAVGIAFGLGVLSVPVQLYAARMPLWRARRNLQAFLAFGAVGCLVLVAILAVGGRGSPLAVGVLALTVCAEIALSVLYATAWQPLLSYGLSARDRQLVNSRWRATGGVLLAAALVLFGLLPTGGRVLFIGLVGGAAVAMLLAVRRFAAPARPDHPPRAEGDGGPRPPVLPGGIRRIYRTLGVAGFASWPLFLIYCKQVLWPSGNLGLIGAVQLAGTLAAALAWTSTSIVAVVRRARTAAGALVLASTAMLLVEAPVDTAIEGPAVLLLLAGAAASTTIILLSLMELAHGMVSEDTSVRTLTLYDVIGSTSFQIGLVSSGFLVEASQGSRAWTDPYRLFVALASLGLLGFVLRMRADGRT